MGLLQPGVAMATVSLLHGGERFLLVDTPKAHRAEDVHRIREEKRERIQRVVGDWELPSASPVVGSRDQMLLVNELDAVDGASVERRQPLQGDVAILRNLSTNENGRRNLPQLQVTQLGRVQHIDSILR